MSTQTRLIIISTNTLHAVAIEWIKIREYTNAHACTDNNKRYETTSDRRRAALKRLSMPKIFAYAQKLSAIVKHDAHGKTCPKVSVCETN